MSGTDDRKPGDELDEERDVEIGGTGTGRTLFGRTAADVDLRKVAYGAGGAVVAVLATVFGVRWLRGRRG